MILWAWTLGKIKKIISCTVYFIDFNLALHYQFYAINQLEIYWWWESGGYSDEGRPEETLVHSSDNFSNLYMHWFKKKEEFP